MNKHLIPAAKEDYFNLTKKTYQVKGVLVAPAARNVIHKYSGRIWVDGIEVYPDEAFALRSFYECDFDWGEKGGISSHTTSLAICLSIFQDSRIAQNLYECFKEEYLHLFPTGDFEIEINLEVFLGKYESRLHPYLHSRFCYAALIDSREILLYQDPVTGLISTNLAENYASHNGSIPDVEVRRLNERKQRLVFRLFAKDRYLITGTDFEEVMVQAEEVMSRFYWKSLERLVGQHADPFYSDDYASMPPVSKRVKKKNS
jgi:hypothetical protein